MPRGIPAIRYETFEEAWDAASEWVKKAMRHGCPGVVVYTAGEDVDRVEASVHQPYVSANLSASQFYNNYKPKHRKFRFRRPKEAAGAH